jgi:peptidoglycan/xylan/chitin deacetylase (PgdA/CDA1 family)
MDVTIRLRGTGGAMTSIHKGCRPLDLGVNHSRRDLAGYGPDPPNPHWPGGAKLCISFVVNYEEGGENVCGGVTPSGGEQSTLNFDKHAETNLTETGVASAVPGAARAGRNLNTEGGYDFGAHRGFHRILDLFRRNSLRFTCWAVGRAVELNPDVVKQMEDAKCEVASHSWRWIDYHNMDEGQEREHIRLAFDTIRKASPTESVPLGWYTGRQSIHTRRLVYEHYRSLGLLDRLYDSDAYDEDLPYYVTSPSPSTDKPSPPLLVVPYTLDNNDMKFAIAPGFSTAEHFFTYLKDAVDVLLEEGKRGAPKMMSIGLHCRIVGRPGRFRALERFVEYVKGLEGQGLVWIPTRIEIADHWRKTHPPSS